MLRKIEKKNMNIPRGVLQYLSGMYAGFVVVCIYTPIELLKIRIQANKKKFSSYSEVTKNLVKKEGINALYKGFVVTVNRDVYSYGVYFYVYFAMKEHWESRNNLNNLKLFFAGGLAGILSWIVCYPFDPMKTIIQACETKLSQKEAYYTIKNKEGYSGFFRGMSAVLIKAFFQHGIVFISNDLLHNFFINYLSK